MVADYNDATYELFNLPITPNLLSTSPLNAYL